MVTETMSSQSDNSHPCRTCLDAKCSNDSVVLSDSVWSQLYEFCIGLSVNKDDATLFLCEKCANKLQDFGQFKRQCKNSDLFWKSISKDIKCVDGFALTEEKEEIDYKDDLTVFEAGYLECFVDNNIVKQKTETVPNATENKDDLKIVIKRNDKNKMVHKKVKYREPYTCYECNKICKNRSYFISHKKKCSALFKCKQKFTDGDKTVKTKSDIYYCGICDYNSKDIDLIKRHLSEHSSNNDLNCKLCGFIGRDFADMVSHRYTHHPEENFFIFFCHICNKRGGSTLSMQFHYRKFHLNKKGGLCSFCNKTFSSYRVFRDHEKLHTTDKCYVCDHCGMKFLYKHEIIVHLEQHENIRRFVCETCGRGFKRKSGLNDHMRVHSKKVGVKCTHCNRNFKSQTHLEEHMKRVNREKNYFCPICSKAYTFETEMRRHMYWHTDEKPFSCEVCGQTYKTKGYMKVHMLTHTGHFPYKCPSCDKPFISRGAVRRHQSVHTGIRAHKCSYCDKSFHNKKLLSVHCKSRHKEHNMLEDKSVELILRS